MLVLGIDEGGRGPLIGPMVIAGVMLDEAGAKAMKDAGVKDSKLLSPHKREILESTILQTAKKWHRIVISPAEIDNAVNSSESNLNWLEAEKAAVIINKLAPDKIIVDCPSNNILAYKNRLLSLVEKKVIAVVEHKADMNYVECAAASIIAKVERDRQIETLKKKIGIDFGSGYPSDPKTQKFLATEHKRHAEIFRKSWMPYKNTVLSKQKKLDEYEVRK